MPDNFHDCAFILEFFEFVLLNDFTLDLLDSYYCVLPSSSVNNTISSFGKLSIIRELLEGNFIVLHKRSGFVRVELIASVLLLLN